ncbi:hypothetical protein LCGC14_0745210 [marine sediment metagenome]|uniref:Uncharacterized protein n=1 Tax=marine sediment metagenome TaxID=412755 RepID=A0A0F9TCL4_9ZZZZ
MPRCRHCGEAGEVHGLDPFGGVTGPSALPRPGYEPERDPDHPGSDVEPEG